MITTPNMSLTAWDLANDPYSHAQLANNWIAVDTHDHSAGKGVQVPTGGIVNAAVTSAKIASAAVGTAQIADASVTVAKLGTGILPPLGTILPWWRPNTSTGIPTGWVVPIGQSLTASNHDFVGGGTIVLPDLRNRFLLGADTSGTGTDPASPPAIGAQGGSQTGSLSHSHTVNSHSHTVDAHNHSHMSPLVMQITGSGGRIYPVFPLDPFLDGPGHYDFSGSSPVELGAILGPPGLVETAERYIVTSSDSTPGTNSSSPGTSSALASTDIRPAFCGVLYILKVKNS